MHYQNTIIGKILTPLNRRKFKRFVDKYNGDFAAKKMTCWEQFIAIFLGQIGNCSSLREIESTIKFHANEHYHLGLRGNVARSTLADANETRDWRIYRDIFFDLIANLNQNEQKQSREMVKIIDSSPIPLNLNQHKWAEETLRIKGIKLHVVYDLKQEIPTFFDFSGAKTSDVEMGKTIDIQRNVTYVFDRAYLDFNWWYEINNAGAFFVTRLKKNNAYNEITEMQATNDIISSQIISLKNKKTHENVRENKYYGKPLRRIEVKREGKEVLVLVTNDFKRSDEEIAELYKQRWQIELFFKWIKQNLKIKKFLGRSENAIKTQICIAMIGFILIRLMENLKEFCKKVSPKTLITIAKNGLFSRLSMKKPPPRSSCCFKQLCFNLFEFD